MMRAILVLVLLGVNGCIAAHPYHCANLGENAFCAANEPDHPYCSPCASAEQHRGCVAEEPSVDACPEYEPPDESTDDTTTDDTTTDDTTTDSTDGDTATSTDTTSSDTTTSASNTEFGAHGRPCRPGSKMS
jgi:hypothetical protein